jgi:hypothetical protein
MSNQLIFYFSGALILLLSTILRRDPARRWQDYVTTVGFVAFGLLGTVVLMQTCFNGSPTCDATLLRADRTIGLDTLAAMRWVQAHHWLWLFLDFVYSALCPVIALAWVAEQNPVLRRSFIIGGVGCFLFYWMFPAIGPAPCYYEVDVTTVPRNCMPSMHFGWALMLAVNARRPFLILCFSAYSMILAVSTIGLGAHYLVDLLAAVPFVAVCQMVAVFVPWRVLGVGGR